MYFISNSFLRISFFLLSIVTIPCVVSAEKIIFTTQDFQPFSYLEKGEVSGPIKEIIQAVCNKAGFETEFKLLPWPRAIHEAKSGKAHGLFVVGWNKPRTTWLYFSHPVLKTEYGFFFHKDDPIDFNKVSDLRGKGYTVGVFGPSNTSKKLSEIAEEVENLKIDITSDDIAGFKKLSHKRIQAVYSNRDAGLAIISKLQIKNIKYGGKERSLKYYIGFVKDHVSEEDFKRFNHAYKELYQQGDIKRILDKYGLEISELEI